MFEKDDLEIIPDEYSIQNFREYQKYRRRAYMYMDLIFESYGEEEKVSVDWQGEKNADRLYQDILIKPNMGIFCIQKLPKQTFYPCEIFLSRGNQNRGVLNRRL